MPASDTQVSVESVGNLERRMTLTLPAERLETQVGSRLREMARTARIKGFLVHRYFSLLAIVRRGGRSE